MSYDRPLLGISLMLGFCIIAPLGDAFAKLIGQSIAVGPMLFLRFLVQAVLLAPFIVLSLKPWKLSRRAAWLCLIRTLLHITGIGLMFAALKYIPLADAVAIVFVLPFITLLLGWLFLGEEVGPVRIITCAIGFVGTLLVVQPSFAQIGWVATLPLLVALNFAVFMLITRLIARETDPIGLQFVSGVMASALLLPFLLLGQLFEFPSVNWPDPTGFEWFLLLGVGVLGTLAHLLMTWSLRYAPSTTVTPMQYIEIPIAALVGLVVFAEWPNALAMLGMAITIAAGLFMLFYEQAKARQRHAAQQQQSPAPAAAG